MAHASSPPGARRRAARLIVAAGGWLEYTGVNFGTGYPQIEVRVASAVAGANIGPISFPTTTGGNFVNGGEPEQRRAQRRGQRLVTQISANPPPNARTPAAAALRGCGTIIRGNRRRPPLVRPRVGRHLGRQVRRQRLVPQVPAGERPGAVRNGPQVDRVPHDLELGHLGQAPGRRGAGRWKAGRNRARLYECRNRKPKGRRS